MLKHLLSSIILLLPHYPSLRAQLTLSGSAVSLRSLHIQDSLILTNVDTNEEATLHFNKALSVCFNKETCPLSLTAYGEVELLGGLTTDSIISIDASVDANAGIYVEGVRQPLVVRSDRFLLSDDLQTQELLLGGWSFSADGEPGTDVPYSEISHCQNGVTMLGGFQKFQYGEVFKHVTGLPPHSLLKVRADIHALDWWQSDSLFIRATSDQKSHETPDDTTSGFQYLWVSSIVSGGSGMSICGSPEEADPRFLTTVELLIPHTGESISFGFGTSKKPPSSEVEGKSGWWGLSFFEISIL